MRLSSDLPSKTCRVLFAVLLVLVWVKLPAEAAQAADEQPAGAADRKKAADTLERLFKALEAADRDGPRETFDAAAIVKTVGRDPAKLFEWVRDNTHWVPYRGALRGPAGVLMDRVGNSIDRSLLLAELLRGAGQEGQLMRATLTDEQARAILGKVRPLPENWLAGVGPASEESDERVLAYARQFGVDEGLVRKSAADAAERNARSAGETTGRIKDQVPAVAAALEGAAAGGAVESNVAVEALKDHWWVARRDGDTWVDLDPLLPDAKPGAVAAEEVQGEPLAYDGKLPDDPSLCHEVQITVTIQRWTGGRLEEHPVLTHTLRPAEVLGRRVAVAHVPTRWPDGENLLGTPDGPARFRKIAAEQQEWAPVLAVGAEQFIQKGFTDTGRVIDSPALNPIARTGATQGRKVGGATGLFGELPGGPDGTGDAKPKDDGRLTAEWIDYEIRVPGREPLKVRRELFDVRGPGAPAGEKVPAPHLSATQSLDRSLAIMGQTEILLQPCSLSDAYVGHVAARGALANRGAVLALLRRDGANPKGLDEQAKKVVTPPGAVYALGWARFNWSPVRGDVFLDAPNVISHHQFLRSGPKETLVSVEAFDVVSNDVSVRGATEPAAARQARLRQGVADTAAEAGVLRRVDKHGTMGPLENASELYAAGGAGSWVTLRGPKDPALRKLSLPRDVRARIEQDLAAGYVVVAPQKVDSSGAASAWWRVDRETGRTLGVGRRGWGLAVTEEQLQMVNLAVQIASALKCLYSHRGDHDLYALGCIVVGGIGVAGVFASGTVGQLLSIIGGGGGLAL